MRFPLSSTSVLLVLGSFIFEKKPCVAGYTSGSPVSKDCNRSLGIENGTLVPDQRRTISRHDIYEDGPEFARLNRHEHPQGYRAMKGDPMSWKSVTVELDGKIIVTGIATQGYGNPRVQDWVEQYTLHWRETIGGKEEWVKNRDGGAVFQGNRDSNTTVRNNFQPITNAKEFTIKPVKEHNNVGLRFELYGCSGSKNEKPEIPIKCTKTENAVKCEGRAMKGEELTLQVNLSSSVPPNKVTFAWSVYIMNPNNQWEKIGRSEEDTSKEKLVIKADDLKPDKNYKVNLTITLEQDDSRTSSYNFTTYNGSPKGGSCNTSETDGFALKTDFMFYCKGWVDVDEPLRYEFSYETSSGLRIVLEFGNKSRLSTKLGPGDPQKDHKITVDVSVLDSHGATTKTSFSVKVLNAMNSNITEELYKFAVNNNSEISKLLDQGKMKQATTLANQVLTMMSNEENKKFFQIEQRIEVKDEVIKHMRHAKVDDLQGVSLMASVVAGVTERSEELSEKAQKISIEILENLTHVYTNKSKSSSVEVRLVGFTAKNLLYGIGNILETQRKDAEEKLRTKNITKTKIMVRRVWKLVTEVGDGLLVKKKAGDDVKIKTNSMEMLLTRQDPKHLEKDSLKVGKSQVSFPPSDILLKNTQGTNSSVDIQVLTLTANPFAWDASARKVKSAILSVYLKNKEGHKLNISNLPQDVKLDIESDSKPIKHASFAKPSTNGKMQRHVINLTSSHMTLQIRIEPENGRSLRVYLRHGYPPRADVYDFQVTIPDYSCVKRGGKEEHTTEPETDSKPTNCKVDPHLISVSSNVTGFLGVHYIGVIPVNNGSKASKRVRRSCFENGRQKRSADCLQFKDPPTTPPPTPEIIRPTYDPGTDVKYNMSVVVATCLYLSKSGRWTTEGCKVGSSHENGSLQCLCNHLSSFGGNLIVEPNPIDFEKVWAGFKNMARDGNVVVITVVCVLFGLWILVALLARKADKSDEQKVTPPIILDKKSDENHCYEIYISTGVWRRCGTTANVAIMLYGENNTTDVIPLTYSSLSNKRLFGRGCVNSFILPLKESLGDVGHIKIWHDNSGANPQWFLRQVVIRDIRTDTTWVFVCNRWLAAEREDGKIERVLYLSSSEEINSFRNKFLARVSVGITDGHLWLSVVSRLPTSQFTRVQRVSCCLSILLTVLVVNAMFYHFGREKKDTFRIGPFVLSLRQIVIGIQSSLITIPINLLIVGIFRNIRPLQDNSTKEYGTSEGATVETSKQSRGLPRMFLYVGWALCLLTSLSAGAVTIFYSMAWGAETSSEWLVSILVSFSQDVVFIQPVKVIIIASLLSSIIKKAPVDESLKHARQSPTSHREDNVQPVTLPKGPELERFRLYRVRVFEMSRVLIETVFYLTFAWSLMVVCYGSRDTDHFLMTDGLQKMFHNKSRPQEHFTNINLFWNWTLTLLVPGLYNSTWYNGQKFEYKEGYISNRLGYMVGMPRLRQLRVRPEPCPVRYQYPDFIRTFECLPAYSFDDEETSKYNSPGWHRVTENRTKFLSELELRNLCPKPWQYRNSTELSNLPFHSKRFLYGGGGYVADLGYTPRAARRVIHHLMNNSWTDEHTRVVFIEVMIFEPSSSLFSAVTYLYEVEPTGHGTLTTKINTMALYAAHASGTQSFYAICELIVFISVIYFLVAQAIKVYRMRCEYFKLVWSWIEIAQILMATMTVILSVFRRYHTSKLVKKIHDNPFETSSFHYAVLWSDMENAFMAILVFIITVKLLWILKFNQHICRLAGIMKNCASQLASYAVVYFIAFLAFMQFSILSFGTSISFFSNVVAVFRTQFSLIIGGKIDYHELRTTSRILGSLYLFSFMTIMGTIIVNAFVAILNESYRDARISSAPPPEEQETLAVFLDYAKKRLADKLSKLREKKIFPKSKQYDIAKARATKPTQLKCKYTRLDWLEARPLTNEETDQDEESALEDVKCRIRSIRFDIHALCRSKKYEVLKFELRNVKETEKSPKQKSTFTGILYQAKSKSTSFLNLGEDCSERKAEETKVLLPEEQCSDDDFEHESSTSYAQSMTTALANGNTYKEYLSRGFNDRERII